MIVVSVSFFVIMIIVFVGYFLKHMFRSICEGVKKEEERREGERERGMRVGRKKNDTFLSFVILFEMKNQHSKNKRLEKKKDMQKRTP